MIDDDEEVCGLGRRRGGVMMGGELFEWTSSLTLGSFSSLLSNHCCRLIISPIVLSTTGQHDVWIFGFYVSSTTSELFSKSNCSVYFALIFDNFARERDVKSFRKKLLT